jgi:hypothetical protein
MKRPAIVVLALAIASVVGARLLSRFALEDVAHVMDEIAYAFQAKVFASGRLTAPPLEPRAAFTMWFVEDRGPRHAIFPPGWPAVLAVGELLGAARWVNPLLHGATVVLVGRAGSRGFGARVGVVAAALYAAAPQALLLAASVMSHTLVALSASVVLLACVTVARSRRLSPPLSAAAGISIGVAAATRPLCAVVLLAVLSVAFAAFGRERENRPLRAVAVAGFSAAPPVLALLAYHRALTGSAFRFPQMRYFDEHLPPADVPFFQYRPGCNALGFGAGRGCDQTVRDLVHTPLNALSNLGDNLTSWFLLAGGPVLVAGIALALARKETRRDAALLAGFPLAAFALYALYWHGGTAYGARFYHAALPAAVVLVALGVGLRDRRIKAGALGVVMLWNSFALYRAGLEIADEAWGYWAVDGRFRDLRRDWTRGPAVVMVAFGPDDLHNPKLGFTATTPEGGYWMPSIRALGALAENPVVVSEAEVVFAKFHPALTGALAARFPDRALYLYVAHVDRERDRLEPFDPARFPAEAYRPPPPNFDAFRTAPPRTRTPALFRSPDEANLTGRP